MGIPGSLDQLNTQSYVQSLGFTEKTGLVGLNPDGSNIVGGLSGTQQFNLTSLSGLMIGAYVESTSVPGQVGVILLNSDGSTIG